MKKLKDIFYFGEKLEEYDVRVLNEREVRAAAGILFLLAIISFMYVWLAWEFQLIKIFITIFLIDFIIRIFINPKFSPTMIMGRLVVTKQKVEYVGAPQKKFAWSVGLVLAMIMFFLMIVQNVKGPINFIICLICLIFLFFESAFGICVGCKIYNLFHKQKAQLCPGGVCEVIKKEKIQRITKIQILILVLFIFLIIILLKLNSNKTSNENYNDVKDNIIECIVPDWAKKIGHEEQYKLHHGCE